MVRDETVQVQKVVHRKAGAAHEVGSPLQGRLTKIFVEAGAKVTKNQPLFVIEAMKMESTISANQVGTIAEVALQEGVMVEQDDLVVAFTQS
jgi:pyruvate carboxylase